MAAAQAEVAARALVSLQPPRTSGEILVHGDDAIAVELQFVVHPRYRFLSPPFVVDAPAILDLRHDALRALEHERARQPAAINHDGERARAR